MAQPSYLASGTKPLNTDSKRIRWQRILGFYQNRSGAKTSNNPLQTDTVRRTKYKILLSLGAGSSGGGGGGGGGGGTGDPDVDAFVSCSGITDATQISAVLALATSLKSNSLWNSFDALYPFVGGTAKSNSCNLRNANQFSITWHGGMTFNSDGITSDGSTGYGDTGVVVSGGGTQYVLNSSCIGVYSKNSNPSATLIGNNNGTLAYIIIFNNLGTPVFGAGGPNAAFFSQSFAPANFLGNNILSRTSSSVVTAYSQSSSADYSNASVSLPTGSFFVCGAIFPSAAAAALAFAFIGSGFSAGQITTLRNIITTYQTTLNRQ